MANSKKQTVVEWPGSEPPAFCDVDSTIPITDKFVDGKTVMGSWACMAPSTHLKVGVGLELGKGQEYTKQSDGRWVKTAG